MEEISLKIILIDNWRVSIFNKIQSIIRNIPHNYILNALCIMCKYITGNCFDLTAPVIGKRNFYLS